jgi:hypothetical protein
VSPEDGAELRSLLHQADSRMYASKHPGTA